MGVRTDVPFSELTEQEREIVFHGPPEKKHILYKAKSSNQAGEMDFTYYNAVYTVENVTAQDSCDMRDRLLRYFATCGQEKPLSGSLKRGEKNA